MTKEEKIKEAYIDLGLPFNKNLACKEGWLKIKPGQYSSKYENVDLLKLTHNCHSIRPKSLSGIESNRGWIKIESKEDLPKESKAYFVSMILNGKLKILGLREFRLHSDDEEYWLNNYTHYKPIEKPEPPIY